MEVIQSFTIDHTRLKLGLYVHYERSIPQFLESTDNNEQSIIQ